MTKWLGLIVTAGIAISAGRVSAQGIYPRVASDLDGPYAEESYLDRTDADIRPYAGLPANRAGPLPPRLYGPRYGERSYDGQPYDELGYVPALLPPTAVYGILRDRGYAPLGIPQQRGVVYTISVMSPEGTNGRLIIDARSGRILRFMPAYRMGNRLNEDTLVSYGPVRAPLMGSPGGLLRPPASVPSVAIRTPAAPLPVVRKVAAGPASKPGDAQASIQPSAAAKPATSPPVQPTREMPAAQGLE